MIITNNDVGVKFQSIQQRPETKPKEQKKEKEKTGKLYSIAGTPMEKNIQENDSKKRKSSFGGSSIK